MNRRKKGKKERSHYSDTTDIIDIQIKPTYHPFVHSCFHNYISPLSLSHCSTRLTPSPAFLLVSILGRDPGVAGPLCLAPPFLWTCLFLSKSSGHLTAKTPPPRSGSFLGARFPPCALPTTPGGLSKGQHSPSKKGFLLAFPAFTMFLYNTDTSSPLCVCLVPTLSSLSGGSLL